MSDPLAGAGPIPTGGAASISDMRRHYARAALDERDADPDPIAQFARWFEEARAAQALEPNAMTLATATPDGRPSARVVLLKSVDARGFAFYTDYRSRKGAELDANPRAALAFWWGELERQVRVEGAVEGVSAEEADAYYASRPRGSRIGAWASRQSRPLAAREELEERIREVESRFAGAEIPRPDFWSGFRVLPERIEFWFGRPSRLHERELYLRAGGDPPRWTKELLYP